MPFAVVFGRIFLDDGLGEQMPFVNVLNTIFFSSGKQFLWQKVLPERQCQAMVLAGVFDGLFLDASFGRKRSCTACLDGVCLWLILGW